MHNKSSITLLKCHVRSNLFYKKNLTYEVYLVNPKILLVWDEGGGTDLVNISVGT